MKKSKQFGGVLSALTLAAVMAFMTGAQGEEVTKIDSLDELQKIGEDEESLKGNYILIEDIVASGQENFEPIGDSANRFTGVFDGDGHVITGLTIDRPDEDYVGLFGYVGDGGEVRNVTLEDCLVEGNRWVGGVAGRNDGVVLKSHVMGTVIGYEQVGGLVGRNEGVISENYTCVDVTGDEYVGALVGRTRGGKILKGHATGSVAGLEQVGGLAGRNYEGDILESYATGSVTGLYQVGGLVGENEFSEIHKSYATGKVIAEEDYVGGLVGWNKQSKVSQSYATGAVEGDGMVGGLIGIESGNTSVYRVWNSYATGPVTGARNVGGLVGVISFSKVINSYSTGKVDGDADDIGGLLGHLASGAVTDSFWDTETSGQSESAAGEGKSTDDMQDESTFTGAEWDFKEIWAIDECAYPHLLNNPPPMDEELFGDVTGNGEVTANDLQEVINAVLGREVEAHYEPDVNGDGLVDALDVQLVILVLLGLLG